MPPSLLLAFAAPKKKPSLDVSAHLDESTLALWVFMAGIALFFMVRPELWRQLWFRRVDPRPLAFLRVAMAGTVLWTFLDLAFVDGNGIFFFSDEGLWTTDLARSRYGGKLRKLYDPEHGFEHWYSFFIAVADRFSLLHLRSDPPIVFAHFAALFIATGMVIVGFWTRIATVVMWILLNSLYNYSPVYYTGGDTVLRVMTYLVIFLDWGRAYSIDSWRRHTREIDAGATKLPAPEPVAAWPLYLMMLQLAIIYSATGALKSGRTWIDGSALYYAVSLDHFYRFPAAGPAALAHKLGLFRLTSWIVHWWEILFPIALLGVAMRGYESQKAEGRWPQTAKWRRVLSWVAISVSVGAIIQVAARGAYYYYPKAKLKPAMDADTSFLVTWIGLGILIPLAVALYLRASRRPALKSFILNWILGRRVWLTLGALMHLGIELMMNVGTFVQVMWASYFAFMTGRDVDALWRLLCGRAAAPGEAGRPEARELPSPAWLVRVPPLKKFFDGPLQRLAQPLRSLVHRLQYRVRDEPWIVEVGPGAEGLAARLRLADLGDRLDFEIVSGSEDGTQAPKLALRSPEGKSFRGEEAWSALAVLLPALWLLRPIRGTSFGRRTAAGLLGHPLSAWGAKS